MSEAVLTRNESYQRTLPTAKKRRTQVYNYIWQATQSHCTVTDREISKALHWPINRVTPRRGELVQTGKVVCAGITWDCETRRKATMWKVKE